MSWVDALFGSLGLDGGSAPKPTPTDKVTAVTNIVNSAIVSAVQNCTSSIDSSQTLVFSGSGSSEINDVNISQSGDISAVCLQDAKSISDLQNKIVDDLKSKAVASSGGFDVFSTDKGKNIEQIMISNVNNVVSASAIQNIMQSVKAMQNITIAGQDKSIIHHITLSQRNNAIMKGSQDLAAKLTGITIDDNTASTDNSDTSKFPGSDLIDSVFSGLFGSGNSRYVFFFLVFILVAAFLYFKFGPSNSGSNQAPIIITSK